MATHDYIAVLFREKTMNRTPLHVVLVALWFAFAWASPVGHAQSGSMPSVDEIVNKLNAARANTPMQTRSPNARRTRGVEFTEGAASNGEQLGGTATTGASITNEEPTKSAGVSENRIQFEFNSDRLTPFAKSVVDVFATAVQSESLRSVSFIIEGHTDAVGSDPYNMELSRKRADAVVRYLVESRGLSIDRFSARGKGKRELANAGDPSAADNRRVVWLPLK